MQYSQECNSLNLCCSVRDVTHLIYAVQSWVLLAWRQCNMSHAGWLQGRWGDDSAICPVHAGCREGEVMTVQYVPCRLAAGKARWWQCNMSHAGWLQGRRGWQCNMQHLSACVRVADYMVTIFMFYAIYFSTSFSPAVIIRIQKLLLQMLEL